MLAPETMAAVRAANRNRMQTSLNLALGSALATIGLTIPAVAVVAPVQLASGSATVLQGAVHLVLFAAFLFLAVVP